MRLFLGIPLVDATAASLTRLTTRLRSKSGNLRWSEPESWHITLQFLGNTGADQLECLTARLAKVRSAPARIRLGGLDIFDRVGVFIVEVDLTSELKSLERSVLAATTHCGFAAEERPYHPHITLARAKEHAGRHELRKLKADASSQPAFSTFTANEFLLYESHPDPGGSRYEVQGRFAL